MHSMQLQLQQLFKIGHWAQDCRSLKPGKLLEVEAEGEKPLFLVEGVDLHEVQSDIAKSPWTTTLLVNEKLVIFKLDSGAYVRVVL